MSYAIEMAGKKFNKLLVLNKVDSKYNGSYWLCRCDCGKEKVILGKHLRKGRIKSCGCLRKELPHLFKYAKNHPRYNGFKEISKTFICKFETGAKWRNIKFDVSMEYLWSIFLKQNRKCALTGVTLILPKNNKDFKENNYNASIDRIDSSKNYEEGNIQWVTKEVNRMKWDLPQEKFIEICKLVANYKGETSNGV